MSDTTAENPSAPQQTDVGSYFVANYPPFSVWTPEAVATEALPALHRPPVAGTPLGLYLHIPFCRKRCHFCYFRVYTGKNAEEVNTYLDRSPASGSSTPHCRPSPADCSTSSISAAARRRSSRPAARRAGGAAQAATRGIAPRK